MPVDFRDGSAELRRQREGIGRRQGRAVAGCFRLVVENDYVLVGNGAGALPQELARGDWPA
jgi:hypothetical protein